MRQKNSLQNSSHNATDRLEATTPAAFGMPSPRLRKRSAFSFRIMALLLSICALFIIFGAIFGPKILQLTRNALQPAAPPGATGPFVQPSLSPQQVEAIRHLEQHMQYKQLASLYISHMSLAEELGQLLMVTYNTDNYSADLDYMLAQQYVGGVILYQRSDLHQLRTMQQAQADIARMQQRASLPLLIGIDEEGWNVSRLSKIYPYPSNPKRLTADDIHKSGDPAVAASEGLRAARDMSALGINVNFAPDVDVASQHNGYIDWDSRAFGDNPTDVIKYAGPYLAALQNAGVVGCLKHFVGLGTLPRGINYDPHYVLSSVNLTREQLYNSDLLPFKHFIQSANVAEHPGMIMPTDLLVPSIDPTYPVEFSHTFITDILRNELGYDGVIVTDGLSMGGVQLNGTRLDFGQASLLAMQAGDDMLLDISGSDQVALVINTLKAAIQAGTLSKSRIDASVSRILTLKMEYKVMPALPPQR